MQGTQLLHSALEPFFGARFTQMQQSQHLRRVGLPFVETPHLPLRRLQALLGHMADMNNMNVDATNREDDTIRPQEKMSHLFFEEFTFGRQGAAVRHLLQCENGINHGVEPLRSHVLRCLLAQMKIGSFELGLGRRLDENFVLQAPRAILCFLLRSSKASRAERPSPRAIESKPARIPAKASARSNASSRA